MPNIKEGDPEYNLMIELEQLESLREEMTEIGVGSIEDIDQRLEQLHKQLDSLDTKES